MDYVAIFITRFISWCGDRLVSLYHRDGLTKENRQRLKEFAEFNEATAKESKDNCYACHLPMVKLYVSNTTRRICRNPKCRYRGLIQH